MAETYEHEFHWITPGASHVKVTGTFDNWSQSTPLTKRDDGSFSGKVQLPYGQKILYKYVVDGNWVFGPTEQVEDDGKGNVNNIIEAKEKPAAAPVAAIGGSPEPVSAPGTESTVSEPQTTTQSITSTFTGVAASAASGLGAVLSGLTGAVGAEPRNSTEKPPEPASTPAVPAETTRSLPTVPSGERVADEVSQHPEPAAQVPSVPSAPPTPGDPVENSLKHLGQAVVAIPAAAVEAVQTSNVPASVSESANSAAATVSQSASSTATAAQTQLSGLAQQFTATTGINLPAALGGAPADGTTAPAVSSTKDEPEPVPQRTLAGASEVKAAKDAGVAEAPAPQEASAGAGAASSSTAPPAPEVPSTTETPAKDVVPVAVDGEKPPAVPESDKPTAPEGVVPVTEAAKAADTAPAATTETNGNKAAVPEAKGTPPGTPSKKSNGSRFSTFRRSSKPPTSPSESEFRREGSVDTTGEEIGAGTNGEVKRKRTSSVFGRLKAKLSPHKGRKEPSQ